jgi:hypothetical protein
MCNRRRHVGAPTGPDQLADPPLPAQIVVGPPGGEQLPANHEAWSVHAASMPPGPAAAGLNEETPRSHTNSDAHTATAASITFAKSG